MPLVSACLSLLSPTHPLPHPQASSSRNESGAESPANLLTSARHLLETEAQLHALPSFTPVHFLPCLPQPLIPTGPYSPVTSNFPALLLGPRTGRPFLPSSTQQSTVYPSRPDQRLQGLPALVRQAVRGGSPVAPCTLASLWGSPFCTSSLCIFLPDQTRLEAPKHRSLSLAQWGP